MTTYEDIVNFFKNKNYHLIVVADAEPITHLKKKDKISVILAAGGVATAFSPLAKATKSLFVARGKTEEDKAVVDRKSRVEDPTGSYNLKRVFFSPELLSDYYYGFANQVLWPLCHVAFHKPIFSWKWYEGFKVANEKFAKAIKEEIKGNTLVWLNDYQLSLVPSYLSSKNTIIALFWHIPWPTWEIFRTLPQKKEILESLLRCDFIAFHRGYQARNFLNCVERELEARIDLETNQIFYNKHITTVSHLPMGIDADTVEQLATNKDNASTLGSIVKRILPKKDTELDMLFARQKVILGIDRLDYTKGLPERLEAIDQFFTLYPQYIGKVTYVSILAPSREAIPAYAALRRQITEKIAEINKKYQKKDWQPIHFVVRTFPRKDIIDFYNHAAVCLVTPLDDGMNLVSKEFVVAASTSPNPGMLVLSQFAGSATDLQQALIINPYDTIQVAKTLKTALEMPEKDKKARIATMAGILKERNVYDWALNFLKSAEDAGRDNKVLGQ